MKDTPNSVNYELTTQLVDSNLLILSVHLADGDQHIGDYESKIAPNNFPNDIPKCFSTP